ncbi:hypothetical protein [Bdellovibrio bacteriovorus]|nr:hypothetical protein [Bdellovibrio bacteriovorus]
MTLCRSLLLMTLLFSLKTGAQGWAVDTNTADALSCENPTVKNVVRVPNLPPGRAQDGLGFCYAMAVSTVLDHKYCQAKKIDCVPDVKKITGKSVSELTPEDIKKFKDKIPDNRVSVLDVMAQGQRRKLQEGGIPFNILMKLRKSEKFARESCAPFDKLVYQDWDQVKLKKNFTWWHEYETLYNNYKSLPLSEQDEASFVCAQKMFEIFPAQKNVALIRKALRKDSFGEFMATLTVPETCQKNTLLMPEYKVKKGKENIALDLQVDQLLREGKPIIAQHCALSPKRKLFSKECGPHSNVIVASRTLCCGEVCEKQYQLRDSTFPRMNKFCFKDGKLICSTEDSQGWESAAEFRRKMKLWEKLVRDESYDKAYNSSIVWIE